MTTTPKDEKEEKILKHNSSLLNGVPIEKSEDFLEYVNNNDVLLEFSELLTLFLKDYFIDIVLKPLIIKLMIFIFLGEEYREPMIKIIFPDTDNFNNLEIRDDIEEKFKLFLVNHSENIEEFKAFRNTQKKFRFVIRRE